MYSCTCTYMTNLNPVWHFVFRCDFDQRCPNAVVSVSLEQLLELSVHFGDGHLTGLRPGAGHRRYVRRSGPGECRDLRSGDGVLVVNDAAHQRGGTPRPVGLQHHTFVVSRTTVTTRCPLAIRTDRARTSFGLLPDSTRRTRTQFTHLLRRPPL